MEEPWWRDLTSIVILSDCRHSRWKRGRLTGTDSGTVFTTEDHELVIPWDQISGIGLGRYGGRKNGRIVNVSGPKIGTVQFDSSNATNADLDALEIVARILKVKEGASDADDGVSFTNAKYLGGLRANALGLSGALRLNDEDVRIDRTPILTLAECTAVAVESEQVAKRKIAATLAFGVAGGLSAKGAMNQAFLTFRRTDGALAYFSIDKRNAQEVKAKISPLLRSKGIPIVGELLADAASQSPGPSISSNLVDEIERLVALKNAGEINEDEYQLLKAKLIQ